MAKNFITALTILLLFIGCSSAYNRENAERYDLPLVKYARCNIKVWPGNIVSMKNLQSTAITIPVGTRLLILGPKIFSNAEKGIEYLTDFQTDATIAEKFFSDNPPDMSGLDEATLKNIGQGVARVGMTKEAAYISMGPPLVAIDPNIGRSVVTTQWSYDQIMQSDLWIYYRGRSRFEKKIGVAFDPVDARVNRTEGIWR